MGMAVSQRERNSLDSYITGNFGARQLMAHADSFYYSQAMKAALTRLTKEWQTASQLSAKWTTLNALVTRGDAERRENPSFNMGIDAYQWRLSGSEEDTEAGASLERP